MTFDDRDIERTAPSLHHEWDSPGLWPAIAGGIRGHNRGQRNKRFILLSSSICGAAAAVFVIVAVSLTAWLVVRSTRQGGSVTDMAQDSLLAGDALADIERAEQQYVEAIEGLSRVTESALERLEAPIAANLRERLTAIDAAIAECRQEIARNRLNAHLRSQLLWMYQEKRRTLEEVQERAS
jgi:hypothetical protein